MPEQYFSLHNKKSLSLQIIPISAGICGNLHAKSACYSAEKLVSVSVSHLFWVIATFEVN